MTKNELIRVLENFPPDTKILINGELGWYDLKIESIEYKKVFNIWYSDWNNNGVPYIDYSSEPRDSTYHREPYMGKIQPDYVCKTVGEESVIILG